jgi:hypothetical protein
MLKKNDNKSKKNIINRLIKIIIFFLIIFLLFSFYRINSINYIKHVDIKNNIVNHPENISEKNIVKLTSF